MSIPPTLPGQSVHVSDMDDTLPHDIMDAATPPASIKRKSLSPEPTVEARRAAYQQPRRTVRARVEQQGYVPYPVEEEDLDSTARGSDEPAFTPDSKARVFIN